MHPSINCYFPSNTVTVHYVPVSNKNSTNTPQCVGGQGVHYVKPSIKKCQEMARSYSYWCKSNYLHFLGIIWVFSEVYLTAWGVNIMSPLVSASSQILVRVYTFRSRPTFVMHFFTVFGSGGHQVMEGQQTWISSRIWLVIIIHTYIAVWIVPCSSLTYTLIHIHAP